MRALTDALTRTIRWHRRSLAALAAGLAVLCGLMAVRPALPESSVVVAAARDLPGGTTLAEADLVEVSLPAGTVPAGAATEASGVVGRTINGPLARLSVVTEASVAQGQSLARRGMVVAALPLTDAALAGLVSPGSRIDIIGPKAGSAGVLATDVRVVATPGPSDQGMLASDRRVLLVEVTPAVAAQLAAAAGDGGVTLAVR